MSSRIPIQGTVVGLGAAALVAAGTLGAHAAGALGDPTPYEAPVAKQNPAPAAAAASAAAVDQAALDQAALDQGQRQAVAVQQREAVHAVAARAAQRAKAVQAVRAVRSARQRAGRSSARTVSGDPRGIARSMASSRYGWAAGQFRCLNSLWQRESGWNHRASNNSSGAYGIPQSLPGSKMASKGSDWRTNPATQIAWGLSYIDQTYGSPCSAWSKQRAQGWY